MGQKPLTIEELRQMAGQPVWCPDEEAYGVVMCDSIGRWAGIPFLHGVWYKDGDNDCGVEFSHNIIKRSPLEALMAAVMHNAVKAKKGVEGDDPEKKDEKADEDIQKGD